VHAAPYLGLQLPQEVELFLLLLCRWLFRLCGRAKLHGHPACDDTRERITGFFAQVSRVGWSEGDAGIMRKAVEKQADMIGNYLLRLLPRLSSNRDLSVEQVILNTAQEPGQPNGWDSDILAAWPGKESESPYPPSPLTFLFFFTLPSPKLLISKYTLVKLKPFFYI
jgi:hypothetical protein